MSTESLVSVIVPVYNVENYLNICINSIVNQTLKDIEIILVDDGSTDKSGIICDEFALKDDRIRVIHKSNQGLSSARNVGINAAVAQYIMFVDSDDWIEPEFCEAPYKVAMDNKADLVLFKYKRIFNDGKITWVETNLQEGSINERDAMYFNVCISPAAMFGLYRKELYNNILYPFGKLHEDLGTTHKLVHKAKKIYFCNAFLYNYRVGRPGSITTLLNSRNHPDKVEMIIRRIIDLYNWGYEEYVLKYVIFIFITYGLVETDQCNLNQIVNNINAFSSVLLSWKQKVMFRVFKFSPMLFDFICVATGKRIKLVKKS